MMPSSTFANPSARTTFTPSSILDTTSHSPRIPSDSIPELPSLVVHVSTLESAMLPGDTAVFTITVINQADYGADDLQIELPLPDGVHLGATHPESSSQTKAGSVEWRQPRLDAQSSTTFSIELRLLKALDSGAVVLVAAARARGLDLPVYGVGGALATDRHPDNEVPARFAPGRGGQLKSPDGRVTVDLPAKASDRALSLQYQRLIDAQDSLKQRNIPIPPKKVGDRLAVDIFVLSAEDDAKQDVHVFDDPVTLTIRYTSEQLRVLGIGEGDLELYWFDESQTEQLADGSTRSGSWVRVPSQRDSTAHTIVATLNHFSAYGLADGSSPSAAYMPSVKGWQVSTFTGAATYSYPIEVPAGSAGMKPNLALSYSSAATDGESGMRPKQQAGWVGKGWSLDVGSIQLHRVTYTSYGSHYDYYTLALDGQSYELVRGDALTGNPNPDNPTHWKWHETDDQFMRIRVIDNGLSWDAGAGTSGRGGIINGVWQPRYTWQIWTKDGTRYDFNEDVWWGWVDCNQQRTELQTNRWMLSQVIDTHGNSIQYSYGRQAVTGGQATCSASSMRGTVDQDIWLTEILWGMNPSQGASTPRYRVIFTSSARTNDTAFDTTPSNIYLGALQGMTRETRQLNDIQIWSNPSGTWELVHQYHLSYDYSLLSDAWICNPGCIPDSTSAKLTLKSIEEYNKLGQANVLPITTFGYKTTAGSGAHPEGGWNRLYQVNNGQGGIITYTYDNIENLPNMNSWFQNRHRINQVTLSDGRGNVYPWIYSYGTPNVNALGTILGNQYGWGGMQAQPNSAVVYYLTYLDDVHRVDNEKKLTSIPMKEFRGHNWVKVLDPTGAEVEHHFRQGEINYKAGLGLCDYPTSGGSPLTGSGILADPCFEQLAAAEMLKGREWLTRTRASAGGPILQEVEHRFGVIRYDWGPEPLSGLYRSFRYPKLDITKQYEGNATPLVLTRLYCYEPGYQANVQHGNRTHTLDYLGEPSFIDNPPPGSSCDKPQTIATTLPYRATRTTYTLKETSSLYLLDRVTQQVSFDGTTLDGNGYMTGILSLKESFYDGSRTFSDIPGLGELWLERSYHNATESPMRSMDVSYGYDAWGNRTTTTTYADWGTRSFPSYSLPGNGSTARTSTIVYDPVFHAFSKSSTNALGQVERAQYDYRMGTLIKVGGPNVPDDATFDAFNCTTANVSMEISCASYDNLGRMATLVRPGDTLSSPTLSTAYADSAIPFRYTVSRKVSSASGDTQYQTVQFYDGLGRKIQEKREVDGNNTRMIVSDMAYDGLDRSIAASQPRYDSTAWDAYIVPTAGLFRPTTTTYDALGRTRRITQPDGSYSELSYSLGSMGTLTTAIDARQHKTTQESDLFGRLRQVVEYSGNNGGEGAYSAYATTTYTYDKLDRLAQVNDALGNVTGLGYDLLSRKTSMSDPDMGSWSYSYAVNGTLASQTDARGIVTTLGYDALDRLTSKSYSAGGANRSFSYDEAAGGVAKGRRTSICAYTGSSCTHAQSWVYDGRGRQTSTTQTVNGRALTMAMSYDSADRMLTQTYPGGEVVTTSYDVAGRALSLCTSLGGCYVDNSGNATTYTALDQPATRKLGNGLTTTWSYTNVLARLDRMTTPTVFDRSYTYDPVGNVSAIRNVTDNQTLNYSYDHRDRLTRAWTVAGTALAPALPQQAMYPALDLARTPRPELIQAALVRDLATALDGSAVGKVAGGYARPGVFRAPLAPQQQSSSTLAQDTFTRTVSNGWGTATTGGSYGVPSSNASDYSVNGSVGRMIVPSAGTGREILLNGVGSGPARDVDITVRVATSKLPAGTGEMRFILLARTIVPNTSYRGLVRILPSGQIKLEIQSNVNTSETILGGSTTISGVTASANSYLRFRMQVSGINPTTIQMRVWADTATEPTTWQISRTDSAAILQQAGTVGMRTQFTSGATNAPVTGSWDDWLVTLLASDPSQQVAPSYDQSFGYDQIGNLTSKAGVVQQYGANNNGTGARPHAVRIVGGSTYTYDANGNLTSSVGRTLTWNAENQPTQIVSAGITESYSYDADGARITRTVAPSNLTTRYVFGGYEVEGAVTRIYYSLGGQPIAVRDSGLGLSYLYGDHIGSVSASTTSSGVTQNRQVYDPWGKVISGSLPQTRRNFTGQYLDDTGLLFYNARYYDPGIGRFVSADTMTPDSKNPQDLNRYTYVLNNPVRLTDPSGHCGSTLMATAGLVLSGECFQKGEAIWNNASSIEDKALGGATMALSAIGGAAMLGAVSMGAAAAAGAATGAVLGGTALAAVETSGIGTIAVGSAQMAVANGVAGAAGAYAGQKVTGQPIDGTSIAVAGAVSAVTGGLAGAFPKALASTGMKVGLLNAAAGGIQSALDSAAHGQKPNVNTVALSTGMGFVAGRAGGSVTPRKAYTFPNNSSARFQFAENNFAAVNYVRSAIGGQISNAPISQYLPSFLK